MSKSHDEIAEAILSAVGRRKGDIRLIGRLLDPRLGHSAEDDALVLIGDLHLLSPARQEAFGSRRPSYAEEPSLLAEILAALAKLKKRWRDGGASLRTFQLGDFFDVWREFPRDVDMSKVGDDVFGPLRDILYRGVQRGRECLKAVFLLGNHDCRGTSRFPETGFWVKAFNHTGPRKAKPFLLALHGDVFDWVEKLPAGLKSLMVNLAGKASPESCYPVGVDNTCLNKPPEEQRDAITEPEHALAAQGAPAVVPGKSLPRSLCQSISDVRAGEPLHKHLPKAHAMIETARRDDSTGSAVRVIAMGHTHHARMVFHDPGTDEPPLLLMDVGAWYEDCRYVLEEGGREVVEHSAQLGVIAGNDARLYQIHIPR